MDDMVSRQAAMDFVGSMEMCDEISAEAYKKLMNYLEELPSAQPDLSEYSDKLWRNAYERGKRDAQPERKRGEWTNDNSCQFCGFQPWFERDIHTLSLCPNCGADMRGEQE